MNIEVFNSANPPTVEDFRKMGYKVAVRHLRPLLTPEIKSVVPQLKKRSLDKLLESCYRDIGVIRQYEYQEFIFPRGGVTIVSLEKDGNTVTSESKCSCEDSYNRKYGIQKCLWRIVSQLHKTEPAKA